MATITTAAGGNWSAGATWVGGNPPGPGDDVSQGHNLIIDVDVDIGSSGVNGTNAITQTAARTLTMLPGTKLTLRGDYLYRGTFAVKTTAFKGAAGCEIVFDSTAAASPSTTKYSMKPFAGGTGASLEFAGTVDARCIVRSETGGGNGWFNRNGMASIGQLLATYTDFINIGDATNPMYEIFYGSNGITGTQSVTLTNCTFEGVGQLTPANSANANTVFDVQNCWWKSTAHATRSVSLPAFTVAGTKVFKNNVVDKDVFVGDGVWDLTDTYFLDGYTTTTRTTAAIQDRILLVKKTQPTINLAGDISHSLVWKNGVFTNPHWLSTWTWNREFSITDCIFAYSGDNINGDVISGGNPSAGRVHTVSGCILIPLPDGTAPGKFLSNGGGANVQWDVYHCTFPSDRSVSGREHAISYGETYAGHATIIRNAKSNLAHSITANRAVVVQRHTGTVQLTSGANVSHNGTVNGYDGTDGIGYDSYSAGTAFSGTAPGANDVAVTTDPFVDRNRKPETWDASLGGPGTMANAIAEMAKKLDPSFNPAYSFDACYDWISEGWKVTGAAGQQLKDAGHDGATIGAMEYVAAGLDSWASIYKPPSARKRRRKKEEERQRVLRARRRRR